MPDDDKTTNTNQPITEEVPTVGQIDPTTTPTPPPTTTPDTSGQAINTPPPPPMQDGAVSPPPPIVEEKKPEETAAVTQETGATENAQTIPNIPPVISTSDTGGKKPVNKKMIATILGVLVLVGGVGAGVILVQNQQDIREKASGTCAGGVEIGETACSGATSCVKCTQTSKYDYPTFVSTSQSNCEGKFCGPVPTSVPTAKPSTTPTKNACEKAGGACYGEQSCYYLNRATVNGGLGCSANKICCSTSTSVQSACESAGHTCIHDSADCPIGSGAPQSCTTTSSGDPVNRTDNKGYCCKSTGPTPTVVPTTAPTPKPTSKPTSKPTLPPGVDCSCLTIKAFDDEWNIITNLSSLVAGDIVRFTVAGKTNSGKIEKARFTINGTLRPEVTAKRSSTSEFYDEYTIPEGVSTYTINAELYHSKIGWF
jgi:hypothetical protein